MVRQMLAGTTACVVGVEAFFGGLLLSIIAGNQTDLAEVASAKRPARSGPVPSDWALRVDGK
jgi:hypothetical protein